MKMLGKGLFSIKTNISNIPISKIFMKNFRKILAALLKNKEIAQEESKVHDRCRNDYLLRATFRKWFELLPVLREENYHSQEQCRVVIA
jgi:hypothetical protein